MTKFILLATNNGDKFPVWAIVLSVILILFIISSIIYIFVVKLKKIKSRNDKCSNQNKVYDNKSVKNCNELQKLKNDYINKLSELTSLDRDQLEFELKNELISDLKKNLWKEYDELKKEFDLEYKNYCNNLIISTLDRIGTTVINESSLSLVVLEDDNLKGKIIGKDGRNKKLFEELCGVDLIIDKEKPEILLSSSNTLRRKIAKKILEELIKSKHIDSSKINSLYDQIKTDFDNQIYNIGKKTIEQDLSIYDLNPSVYSYVGKLFYRHSYGQNILQHSIESALIATELARQLNIDPEKAKKAAFFHDIGKSIDIESDINHIQAGINIANECGLDQYIIDAISSHHDTIITKDIYSAITKIADSLSASRIGARVESINTITQRANLIEQLILDLEEVKTCYVLKAARQVHVMVCPSLGFNHTQLSYLAYRIKHMLENHDQIKGFKIDVIVSIKNTFKVTTSNNN